MPRNSVKAGLLVFAVYLACVVGEQKFSHATELGFGAYPDESSHYVTGLMVHDYLRTGLAGSPIAYARNYYLYIPLLGIGHWPPLFYGFEGLWMLVAGTGRGATLLLMALFAAMLAFTVYLACVRDMGRWAAFLAGAWLLALPVMRWSVDLVMLDVFTALTIMAATLAFGRYLDSERPRDAVLFGLAVGLAFLAKPAAICLAFVPPIAIVLTRKYRLLKSVWFWSAAPIVIVMAGAWYYYTLPLALYGHTQATFGAFVASALPAFFRQLWGELGILAIVSLIGWAVWVRRGSGITGTQASLAALPIGVLFSLMAARVDLEPRYLIPAIVPLLAAAAAGAGATGIAWVRTAAMLVISVALFATSSLPKLIVSGDDVSGLAARVLHEASSAGTTVLVSGPSSASEGRVMAEIAMDSPARPRNSILRATKLLADLDWNATQYRPLCQSPEEVLQMLERSGVQFLVLDVSGRWTSHWSHYDYLVALPGLYPERFEKLASFPAAEGGGAEAYRLYRVHPVEHPGAHPELMLKKLNEKFKR